MSIGFSPSGFLCRQANINRLVRTSQQAFDKLSQASFVTRIGTRHCRRVKGMETGFPGARKGHGAAQALSHMVTRYGHTPSLTPSSIYSYAPSLRPPSGRHVNLDARLRRGWVGPRRGGVCTCTPPTQIFFEMKCSLADTHQFLKD